MHIIMHSIDRPKLIAKPADSIHVHGCTKSSTHIHVLLLLPSEISGTGVALWKSQHENRRNRYCKLLYRTMNL